MSGLDDVLIFPEHCPNHGAKASRWWIEPAGEGYELPFAVTVAYRCRQMKGLCLGETRNVAEEPQEVRDFAQRRIPKTDPPSRTYFGEE